MEKNRKQGENSPHDNHWIERENNINEEHQELVVQLLGETDYIIQGEIEIQESDFDYRWEVCDILFDDSKTIRKGIINTGYIFDPDTKTMFPRDEF